MGYEPSDECAGAIAEEWARRLVVAEVPRLKEGGHRLVL